MLETDELYFAHPSTWEDPYEGVAAQGLSAPLFAQCWCRNGVSDAMWRIYSPNKLGVRIRTTRHRLLTALLPSVESLQFGVRVGNVKYVNELEYIGRMASIQMALAKRATFARMVAPLYLKRLAFKHEEETRVVIMPASDLTPSKSRRIKVDVRKLIDSVLIDPRAPKEYVAAYQHFLTGKLKFPGRVRQSVLYTLSEPREP